MYICHVMYLDPSEVSNFLMGKIVEISHAPDTHTVLLHGRLCHGVKLSVDILGHFIVPTYLPRMILWNSEILPQIKGHKRQWTIWWTMINLTLKLIIYLGISLTPPQCRVHPTCWVGRRAWWVNPSLRPIFHGLKMEPPKSSAVLFVCHLEGPSVECRSFVMNISDMEKTSAIFCRPRKFYKGTKHHPWDAWAGSLVSNASPRDKLTIFSLRNGVWWERCWSRFSQVMDIQVLEET